MFKLFNKHMRKNKKGFTLVELVVVIAILGILAMIAVPRLLGFQERAKAQADQQTAVQVRNAVALMYANGEVTFASGTTTGSITLSVGNNITPTVSAGLTASSGAISTMTGTLNIVGAKDKIITIHDDGYVQVTN